MRLRGGVLVVAAALLLAGCSDSAPSEQADGAEEGPLAGVDVSDASDRQAAEIRDRVATAAEYRAAFERYEECLSTAGFELRDVEFRNSLYEFGVPNAAVQGGTDAECYVSEFRYTDILWQSTDAVQNNSETAKMIRKCLRRRGIAPADTPEEMNEQLRKAGIEPPECLP